MYIQWSNWHKYNIIFIQQVLEKTTIINSNPIAWITSVVTPTELNFDKMEDTNKMILQATMLDLDHLQLLVTVGVKEIPKYTYLGW